MVWLDRFLCRLGWHRWWTFMSYTGSGTRYCQTCDRRQFRFSGRWQDVPADERADGFGR